MGLKNLKHKLEHKLKHKKWIAISLCGVLLLSMIVGVLLLPKTEEEEDILWREYSVECGTITASLDESGKLELTGVSHGFDVDLKIDTIFVKVGQEVKKGDQLVQYSRSDIEKKIKELKKNLETAKRTLEDQKNAKKSGALQSALANAQSQQAAQNTYESSKRELNASIQALEQNVKERQETLASLQQELDEAEKTGEEDRLASLREQISQSQGELDATKKQLDDQNTALANLKADYDKQAAQNRQNQGIQNQIDALNQAGQSNGIKNAQAEVEQARASLQEAEALLKIPVLTAKTDGIVTELSYLPGDEVPAGKSIVTIGESGNQRVVVQISQEDIGSVEEGQPVEMRFSANPDEALTGKVKEKSLLPAEEGDGVTYKVVVVFDQRHPELLKGMTCNVKFILKRVENVLTLANKAITARDGKQFVTVQLPNGAHEEREIKTGFSDGRVTEITAGLAEGDTVVVAG